VKTQRRKFYSRTVSEAQGSSVFHSDIIPHVIVRLAGHVIDLSNITGKGLEIEVNGQPITLMKGA